MSGCVLVCMCVFEFTCIVIDTERGECCLACGCG